MSKKKIIILSLLSITVILFVTAFDYRNIANNEITVKLGTNSELNVGKDNDNIDLIGESSNDNLSNEENTLENKKKQGIAFVQAGYFYSDTVFIEIESDRPCKIYYTMDGSEPDESKELYEGKIELKSRSNIKVYCIKAKGYYEDGTETDTIVHTYFVGDNVHKRFDTLVFSIVSDPYNLYDYEYGILIEGKLRDEHIKNNPDDLIEPPDPANFNMRGRESEREAYLEILEPDGNLIASQNVGIRVYGGWSRAHLQKSIKIFARKEYDQINNKLRYEFFPRKKAASGDGTIIDSFKRLVLRNCGNDNGFGFIRDELLQTLAGQAGYADYHGVRPAALFINGDYRGHLWLHEVYCDEYFEEHYGKYSGNFEILEGGETFKNTDDETKMYAISDYEEAYSYAYKDLTDDLVFDQLCQLIDIENYLAYYALQIFIGNEDWPGNNYKVYRYYPTEDEEYREAPFDGKWRYLLHDLDFSFGIYGKKARVDHLKNYLSNTGEIKEESPLFSQLMRREDCKEYFVKKTLDLINGAFSPENVSKVIDQMNSERLHEQSHMYNKNLVADWVQLDQLWGQLEEIKSFAKGRVIYILGKYRTFFNLGDEYKLYVQPAEGGGVKINGIETYSEFKGSYYPDFNTVISPIIPAGDEFDFWLVNGEIVHDLELIINSSMVIDGKVDVICVFKEKAENPKIIISEVCSDGDEDYIILYNPYEEDILMMGYSISDDVNKPGKLILPARILRSGESLKILGERNLETIDIDMIRARFNLKDGETVTLYKEGEIIDLVKIPDLEKGSTYKRDMKSLRFFEEKR